ncbi:protein rapunzel-like [Megalops cyprinoides]|uniref:protein rapunzel-like n=1 Tax=Megalops cyprinoides TaxID=118141 RepID=UPI001863C039|nr:protein rapunzel-like [Megalops cyprinoides]
MNRIEEWVLQNKIMIEKGVEIIEQGCEALSATVGKLHPILEAVFVASAEILHNPERKETQYLSQQLQSLTQKLVDIQEEVGSITQEIQRISMNKQNFDYEAQVISQYEKFCDFLDAKPEFRERKMERFLCHFESTGGDLNMDALYNAVTSTTREPMLDTVMATEQRSRRAVEKFCAQLKRLFVVGIIAVMGYASLKMGAVGREMVEKWQKRMEDIEGCMKAAVDDCVQNFATQAEMDIERQVLEKQGSIDVQFAEPLLDFLSKKYDWVSWSVRVFNHNGMFLWNWLAGKDYYGRGGSNNFFDILTKSNVRVVISFSVEPKPINKSQIQEQIQRQQLKGKMTDVAQSLSTSIPNCAVYTISRYKEVAESNNFQENCYYYEKYKRAYLCIHSK